MHGGARMIPFETFVREIRAIRDRRRAGALIFTLCAAVLGYAVIEASLQLYAIYQASRDPAPVIARAIPCPGPGLNERTYIVLANHAGQIHLDNCVTLHILGR
jgi:hypothetical protein